MIDEYEYDVVEGKDAKALVDNLNQLVEDTDKNSQWEVITITTMGAAFHQAFIRRRIQRGAMLAG